MRCERPLHCKEQGAFSQHISSGSSEPLTAGTAAARCGLKCSSGSSASPSSSPRRRSSGSQPVGCALTAATSPRYWQSRQSGLTCRKRSSLLAGRPCRPCLRRPAEAAARVRPCRERELSTEFWESRIDVVLVVLGREERRLPRRWVCEGKGKVLWVEIKRGRQPTWRARVQRALPSCIRPAKRPADPRLVGGRLEQGGRHDRCRQVAVG